MNNSSKIKSRWCVPVDRMNKRNIEYALNDNYAMTIMRAITNNFIIRNKEYTFSEIFNVVREGFWNAIKKYNPEKGKFSSYATYACKNSINKYAGITNGHKSKKSKIVEYSITDIDVNKEAETDDIDDKILIRELLCKISAENRKILIVYYYICSNIGDSANYLNISRPTFVLRLKEALREIKTAIRER